MSSHANFCAKQYIQAIMEAGESNEQAMDAAVDNDALDELAMTLFAPTPGIEILQTDAPDGLSEMEEAEAFGLLDELLAEEEDINYEFAASLLFTEQENPTLQDEHVEDSAAMEAVTHTRTAPADRKRTRLNSSH